MRVTLLDPDAARGPVPASTMRRTSCGSVSAITWAIIPPIREAEQVHPLVAEGADEDDGVGSHGFDRRGRRAAGAPTPRLPNAMT
jgi:hypothetical protein